MVKKKRSTKKSKSIKRKRSKSIKRKRSKSKKKSPFKKKDYRSKDGMLTYVWGPSLWHTLHTISFNYPLNPDAKTKKAYKQFFLSLKKVLPCGACRKNLTMNFKKCPLKNSDLENRDTLSRWVYRIHNVVNKMLGKTCNLSYCDVRDRYEAFRARCSLSDTQQDLKKMCNIQQKYEDGCTTPLKGIKSKCVINIVPKDHPCETFNIDSKCKLRR